MTADYRILVEFDVKAGVVEQFLDLVLANAAASVRDEEGCDRFDVFTCADDERRIILYEIYRDAAAFAEHCRTAHFHVFDDATQSLIEKKRVVELRLQTSA